jgi:hypothetical protein
MKQEIIAAIIAAINAYMQGQGYAGPQVTSTDRKPGR